MHDFLIAILWISGSSLVLIAAFILYMIVATLYRFIFFRSLYSEVKETRGRVTDMDYEAPRYNAATKTSSSEQNLVYLKTLDFETWVDDEHLYQRCRIGDKIQVKYQAVYKEPRFWSGKLVFNDNLILTVYCPNDEVVDLDDEQIVSDKVLLLQATDNLETM